MGTKRTPRHRPRRPAFSDEALALFARLEALPPRRRNRAQIAELARLLGLTEESLTMNSVLDRSGPRHPSDEYVANTDWRTCRAVREQLLAAIGRLDHGAGAH